MGRTPSSAPGPLVRLVGFTEEGRRGRRPQACPTKPQSRNQYQLFPFVREAGRGRPVVVLTVGLVWGRLPPGHSAQTCELVIQPKPFAPAR